jgi:hypothetical protein
MKIHIKVREYGGAYLARMVTIIAPKPKSVTSSCTSTPTRAVERLAAKVRAHCIHGDPNDESGITIKSVRHRHYTATWEDPA